MGDFAKNPNARAKRIAAIMYELMERQAVSVEELTELTAVTKRTIRRDLDLIQKTNIPLERTRGSASLRLRKASGESGGMSAIFSAFGRVVGRRFASWAGAVLPRPSEPLMRSLLLKLDVEDIGAKFDALLLLEQAIGEKRSVTFRYANRRKETSRIEATPVKIMVSEGRWFLAGWTEEKIKTFAVSNINDLTLGSKKAKVPESVERAICQAVNVWFDTSREPFEARLYVAPDAAPYIRKKPLAPTQKIAECHHDGALEITMTLTAEMEILPAIRYWLPHVYPLAPISLCDWFENDLKKASEFFATVQERDI